MFENLWLYLLQEKLIKMRTSEAKTEEERRTLRMGLDEADNQLKKAEISRRNLEGEIQRLKMALGEKEKEKEAGNKS